MIYMYSSLETLGVFLFLVTVDPTDLGFSNKPTDLKGCNSDLSAIGASP